MLPSCFGRLPGYTGGDLRCLQRVGLKLEGAMNHYARAGNTWNECITDYACENDSIQPDLQARWEKAVR